MSSENLILMVEDSDEDFVAAERAFRKCGYKGRLKRTADANEAIAFLGLDSSPVTNRSLAAAPVTEPALILLDLNLPGMDGRDLLVEIKRSERLKQIPVVIFTTSNNPRDILYCYRHGASSYHIKTVGFEKFSASINSLLNYWFNTATLPSSIN